MAKRRSTDPKDSLILDDSPQLIMDLGNGLKLYMANLGGLREQDINARVMPLAEHNQMVNNMRRRGGMESVPYCVRVDGKVEVVSGHHRIRAAREAGISRAPILVDESGLSRSEIVAKQLAHNRLVGFDDPDTLRRLFESLTTPDDILQSGLAEDMSGPETLGLDRLLAPHLDMDWKLVSFAFLPHQLDNLKTLLYTIPPSALVAGVPMELFDAFLQAVIKYGRLKNVTNAGTAVALIIEKMLVEIRIEEEVAAQRLLADSGGIVAKPDVQAEQKPPQGKPARRKRAVLA